MGASHIPQPIDTAPTANHSLPMLLLRLRETVLLSLRPVFHQFDLTEQQARVLIILHEAGTLTMHDLAEACCIQSPSLSRIVPRLRARNWVERRKPDDDLRQVVAELTPHGHAVAVGLIDALRLAYGGLTSQLGEKQVRALTGELQATLASLGTPPLLDEAVAEGDDAPRPSPAPRVPG